MMVYEDVALIRKTIRRILKRNGISKENMPSMSLLGSLLIFRKFKSHEDEEVFRKIFKAIYQETTELNKVLFMIPLRNEIFELDEEAFELWARLQ